MATPEGLEDSREPLTLQCDPGFFTEETDRGAVQKWKTGDRVRFKNALPQKLGGWRFQEIANIAGDIEPSDGVARRVWEWVSLDGVSWIAEGTNTKLYLISKNIRYDITPARRETSLTDPFTTTIGESLVVVTDAGHGAQDGDFVTFSGATAVGGLTIDGEYQIVDVVDGNTYIIDAGTAASSSSTGGGSVSAIYDINTGSVSQGIAHGWGTCLWGDGTWGTARGNCSNVVRRLRIWSLDNFGEDLIASPRGGAVYHWDRTLGPQTRAQLLPDAPQTNQHVLVSNKGNQIICLGAYDDVANSPDPMLVRVGDIESLTDFTVTDQNSAFDERLSTGSEIITGIRTRNGVLVFTDTAIYLMQDDTNQVFVIGKIAEGNSAVGPNAVIEVDGTAYVFAESKFMAYDGVYQELLCTVWEHVFDNFGFDNPDFKGFSLAQKDKVYCWLNKGFSEIWWHYPSLGALLTEDGEVILTEDGEPITIETPENDVYVIYNYAERAWYFGSMRRTAMATGGPAYNKPYGFVPEGNLYIHEVGVNAGGEDGTFAMGEFIESWDVQLGEGKDQMHVSEFVPDMKRIAAQIGLNGLLLTLKAKARPQQAAYRVFGPYEFDGTTQRKGTRACGRQMAVRMGSDGIDTNWRAGKFTFYLQPDASR